MLASRSPRRHELLLAAGLAEVTVEPSTAGESNDASAGLPALVLANARVKATDVAARHPGSVVLGADTLVWLEGRPLGKPVD
ncbi:MAG: Maf family protein, partial [Chthoniobacterales bacterium]